MVRLQKKVTTTFCNISVELVPPEKLIHVHPLVKEIFPEELKQNAPQEGRTSHFVQSWEKLTEDQETLKIVKGYKIPLLRTPVQEKIPLNTSLKENQLKEMFEKGAIKKVSQHKACSKSSIAAYSKSISEQSFCCKEKIRGLLSCYKYKNSGSFCTLQAHQNGKFADFQIYDEGKRLHVQIRFEGRLFFSTSRQIMSLFIKTFMGRESLRIPVSVCWSCTSPSNFYQIF